MEKTMTAREVVEARLLPYSQQILLRKIKKGEIPALKINGRYYFTESIIKDYLAQHRVN